jgi:hypothetical protein
MGVNVEKDGCWSLVLLDLYIKRMLNVWINMENVNTTGVAGVSHTAECHSRLANLRLSTEKTEHFMSSCK